MGIIRLFKRTRPQSDSTETIGEFVDHLFRDRKPKSLVLGIHEFRVKPVSIRRERTTSTVTASGTIEYHSADRRRRETVAFSISKDNGVVRRIAVSGIDGDSVNRLVGRYDRDLEHDLANRALFADNTWHGSAHKLIAWLAVRLPCYRRREGPFEATIRQATATTSFGY